jgi:TRAP-type C4-dicarboxylate transport system permease large subunit
VVATLKDVGIILTAMLLVLLLVIVFPELVLFLPRLIAPQFVD